MYIVHMHAGAKIKLLYGCAYVWDDNPRALANGLSPVHTLNHTITTLVFQLDIKRNIIAIIGHKIFKN